MSRVFHVKCDRCGLDCEDGSTELPIKAGLAESLGIRDNSHVADICRGCVASFVQWFNGLKHTRALNISTHLCLPGAKYVDGKTVKECAACLALLQRDPRELAGEATATPK